MLQELGKDCRRRLITLLSFDGIALGIGPYPRFICLGDAYIIEINSR